VEVALSGEIPAPSRTAGRRDATSSPFSWTALGVFGGIGLFAFFFWLWAIEGEPVGAALLLGPILVALTVPLLVRAGRRQPGFDLGGLLLVGLLLRLGLTYQRFTHAVDGIEYHVEGVRLARYYRQLSFDVETGKEVPGTGAMRALSGVVHVVVNDDSFAAFLLMTWLGFLGCWFLYRAFDLSVPDGGRYRYAVLLMLWPSMCFWPSSLGKDAWMLFTIGLAAYGAARVFRRLPAGYTLMGISLLGASFVRPHLALLALVAFTIALMIGRRTSVRETVTPAAIAKVIGVILILIIGSVLISRTQKLLDLEDFSASSLQSVTTAVNEQTDIGGAAFSAPDPKSPTGFVVATVTVLLRPFPTEAHGAEQLVTAAEGVVLLLITACSLRRLATVPRRLRDQPYVMFSAAYVALWILAFGVIANFGILARQRTQMLPFYFALLALPPVVAKVRAKVSGSATATRA
jgi:hypothetical protein